MVVRSNAFVHFQIRGCSIRKIYASTGLKPGSLGTELNLLVNKPARPQRPTMHQYFFGSTFLHLSLNKSPKKIFHLNKCKDVPCDTNVLQKN